jgi:peptide/nickel transport system permease protein
MLTYIVRRLLYSVPVLLSASFIVFILVTWKADPLAQIKMNPKLQPEDIARMVHEHNLDKPLVVRYGYWLHDAFTNRFGTHLLSQSPVWPDIQRVLGHTLQLIIPAILIASIFAIIVGVYSAVRQYSVFDYATTTFTFLGFATPVFWLALILQVIFTNIYLNWHVRVFYIFGLSNPNPSNWLLDRVQHLALPVATLAILSMANYSRYQRAAMLEVINADYIRTARAKGLSERRVIIRHAFRNALIPVVTAIALDFGGFFSGAVVTEFVYQLDGMGNYFLQNLQAGDPYPVMAWLMIAGTMVIIFNLIADLLYGVLDPRIRYA